MIHSFNCKNFYSFGEDANVSFVVNDNAPDNHGYFSSLSGARLSKIETVIGSNASGKTNLLKVLPLLKWLIIDSFNSDPAARLPLRPCMFDGYKDSNSELGVTFEIQEKIYTYNFILNASKIVSEELILKSKIKENYSSKKLFVRTWDEENKVYILDEKNFDLPKGFEGLLRTNASIVSIAIRLNHGESKEIANFWNHLETNVVEAGWAGDHLLPNAGQQLIEALDFYSDNEQIKKEAEKLLSRFDLGLEAFNILKEKKANDLSINVQVVHSFDGHKGYLPIQYESSGTKQLFVLLKTILQVLLNGGTAVIDEFDVNLHPDMVMSLFELFLEPNTNPKNAQILFSTHSHRVLSKLDKYQIILIEKNEKGVSEAWRLDEMSGVRADDNYYTKYIAGAYGAVPKL